MPRPPLPRFRPSSRFITAYAERLDAGSGIQLFRAVHALERAPGGLMPVLQVDSRCDEPLFNAQVWLAGSGCHDEYWQGRGQAPTRIIAGPGRGAIPFAGIGNWTRRC